VFYIVQSLPTNECLIRKSCNIESTETGENYKYLNNLEHFSYEGMELDT